MKPPAWKVGLYSKIVLTVIAVSLAALLGRQLPEEVKAKPEMRVPPMVKVVHIDILDLRAFLGASLIEEERRAREGELPLVDPRLKDAAKQRYESPVTTVEGLLDSALQYMYAMGHRVKFATDDFIILEAE